ncbi:MAG: flippase [Lachnospiraceae bacterium]|nr:MAG: flippase [Lachnospiraceae bacterium]
MDNKIHSVKYNFIMNFILTASNFIFPLITFPYVSRILHAAGNGKVNFAASLVNYFVMLASLGIPTYGVRACAKVRDDRQLLSKTAQEILIINAVSTALVTVSYLICLFTVPKLASDKELFLIEGANIILNMVGANWLYQALEQYDYITRRSIIFKLISVVLMFALVHQQSDYRIYAATTVLASVGSNVTNFIRLRKYISFRKTGRYDFKQHLGPIFILFAQSATISIYTNLDTVMLGAMKSNTDVGLYTAAVKIKTILVSVVSSLGNVLLPRMSNYANKHNEDEFYRLLGLAMNAELFMSFPLMLFFIIEAKDCLMFIAGPEYVAATATMQVINLSVIPIGLTGIIGVQTLTALDREKQVLYSVIVGAVTDFVLNLIMIPGFSHFGAAFATMVAEYLVLVAQLILGRDVVGHTFRHISFLKYGLTAALASVCALLAMHFLNWNALLRLVISAAIFFGVYGIVLILLKDELMKRAMSVRVHRKN